MADVIVGNSVEDVLVALDDKTQIYGLKGNDTLSSSGKNEVRLIGGSGDDVLKMTGGQGTLSGGAGADTFSLNYSAEQTISAVIEDIDPANDKIIIIYDGENTPQLSYFISGDDVIWTDNNGYFNLTLKGSSDASDYFDGTASEYIWDILRITNQERENEGLSPLILSEGLMEGAAIRAPEIVETTSHTRPDGSSCFTAVEKDYWGMGENLAWGYVSPEAVMIGWMNSEGHRANILTEGFKKLGVGYVYEENSPNWKDNWVQMFGGGLVSPDTLSTAEILTAPMTLKNVSLLKNDSSVVGTVLDNSNTNIKSGGTYTIANNFSGTININTTEAVTIDGASAGDLSDVKIVAYSSTADLTIKNLKIVNESGSVITFGSGAGNKLTLAGINALKTSDVWAAVVNIGGGLIVDGGGKLFATAGTQGSSIGYNSYATTTANITIKGGIITTVTDMGAGIGSGANGSVGDIIITGGTLTTTSKWAVGVGAGWSGSSGNISMNGGNGNDSISFNKDYATISGGKGNDSITNDGGENILFKYENGDGFDIIYGFRADSTLSIVGGTYSSQTSGSNVIVTVGTGNVTLQGAASLSAVNIISDETPVETNKWTISGTTAKYGSASKTLATVKGLKSGLKASDGKISGISLSGKVITLSKSVLDTSKVTVSDGYTLKLADDVTKPTSKKAWSLKDTTATYKQTTSAGYKLANNAITYSKSSSKTLVTVSGVKSTDGLSLSGTTVTVANSSVNKSKITVSDGYTLKLADDVTKPTSKKAWSLKDTTATYKQTTSAGYKLADNAITYSKSSSKTLVTVSGAKSTKGLSLSGKVVTVANSALNKSNVTISDGYTLKLGKDVSASTTKKAAFSLSGSTATYKSSYKTASYKLASNAKSISYSPATTPTTLASVKGAASTSGLTVSGKKITLKNSALKSKVTIGGGYEFNFASDYKNATITGSAKADSITTNGTKLSVSGGAGNDTIKVLGSTTTIKGGDGADLFILSAGKSNVISDYKAEDRISISGGTVIPTISGSNVIFTVGDGKITIKGGEGKTITYSDASGKNKTYIGASDATKLSSSYREENYTMASGLLTLDASAVTHGLEITGNIDANKITGTIDDDIIKGGKGVDTILGGKGNDTLWGGKGNDVLTGGDGSDVFVWNKGDGDDLITDYAEKDTISIKGATVKTFSSNSQAVVFNLSSREEISIQGGADIISYVDDKGEHTYRTFKVNGKTITLTENYFKESFNVADYGSYTKINASAVEHSLNIVGNSSANSIMGTADSDTIDGGANNDTIRGGNGNDSLIGGAGKDYLYGGEGNDTLWGGKGNDYLYGQEGNDVFIYKPGEDTDRIYNYEQGIDKIILLSGSVDNVSENANGDVVFKVGTGKIVLDNGVGNYAEVLDSKGNILKQYIPTTRS